MSEQMDLLSGSHTHGGRTGKVTDVKEESLRWTWRGRGSGGGGLLEIVPAPGCHGAEPSDGHHKPEIWICVWNL